MRTGPFRLPAILALAFACNPAWAGEDANTRDPKDFAASDVSYKIDNTAPILSEHSSRTSPNAAGQRPIVAPGSYKSLGDKDANLYQVSGDQADRLYLRKLAYWAEPLDGAPSSRGSVTLSESDGPVSLNGAPLQAGASIASGSVISTGPEAIAAVSAGGVNTIRLAPNSEASITQEFRGGTRLTRVNLRRGLVFASVNEGEKQDFAVVTPAGTAAARGTSFAVLLSGGKLAVFVIKGVVDVLDSNGSLVEKATPSQVGDLVVKTTPAVSAEEAETYLLSLIEALGHTNRKLARLVQKAYNGGLTTEERNYLKGIPTFALLYPVCKVTRDDFFRPSFFAHLFHNPGPGPGRTPGVGFPGSGGFSRPTRPRPTTPF